MTGRSGRGSSPTEDRASDAPGLTGQLARRLLPLTVAVAILISLVPPVSFFAVQSAARRHEAFEYAEQLADGIRAEILAQPELWKWSTPSHQQLVAALLDHAEEVLSIRVVDVNGVAVAGYAFDAPVSRSAWARPVHVEVPVALNGQRAATVVVGLSRDDLANATALLFVASTVVGAVLAALLYGFPITVARGMEGRVRELLEAANARTRRLDALSRVSRLVSLSLDIDEVLNGVAAAAAAATGARLVSVWVVDQREGVVRAAAASDPSAWSDFPVRAVERGQGAIGQIAVEGRVLTIRNVLEDDRMPAADWFRQHRLTSYHGVPIVVQGSVLGVLSLHDPTPFRLDLDQQELLKNFAAEAGVAMHNARLFAENDFRRRTAEALAEVGRGMAQSIDAVELGRRLLQGIGTVLGVRSTALYRLDPLSGDLVLLTSTGADGQWAERLAAGTGAPGLAAAERRTVVATDVTGETAPPRVDTGRRAPPAPAVLAVPMLADAQLVGALAIAGDAGRPFDEDETGFARAFADRAALALRGAELLRELKRRQARLEALVQINQRLSGIQSVRSLLDGISEACGRLLGAEAVAFGLLEADRLEPASAWGETAALHGHRLSRGEGLSGIVAETGSPLLVAGPADDPRAVPGHREAMKRAGHRVWLGVPVKVGGRVAAVLSVQSRAETFSATDREVLLALADQAAIALENARLYEALERRLLRLRAMTHVNRVISSSLDLGTVLGEINRAAAEFMGAAVASFWLADPASNTLDVVSAAGPEMLEVFPGRVVRYGETFVNRVVEDKRAVNIPRVGAEERDPLAAGWWRQHDLVSFLGLPVFHDGALLGVLALFGHQPFQPSDDDRQMFESFVAQTAVAVRNARLFEVSETGRRAAEAVADVGRVLAQTLDPDVMAGRIVERLRDLLRARSAVLFRLDPRSGNLGAIGAAGEAREVFGDDFVLPAGTGVAGVAVAERRAVVTGNLLDDPAIQLSDDVRRQFERLPYRAVLCVPLIAHDRVIGALSVGDIAGRGFTQDETELLQAFADQTALALESGRLHQETQRAVRKLEAKNAELDTVVYSITHDVTAPLVAAHGMAGALLEDYGSRLDEQGRHYLERLAANVEQMERLTRAVLALSHAGRDARSPEPVDLGELAAEVLKQFAGSIREAGLEVVVGALGAVQAVRPQIEQVVRNLVGNAIQYSAGGRGRRIEIGSVDLGESIECWVRDDGIGIAPAYHHKIFRPFNRLNEVDGPGTGVGLAIVKKIVDGVGGRVWVESAKGAGATFRFTWPKAAGETESLIF
jgi:GAF domain-containing protein/two-component sensor histidine kinase